MISEKQDFMIPRKARGDKKMDCHELAREKKIDGNNECKVDFILITLEKSENSVLIPKNP